MKIKNKLRYIFVFGIILLILVSFSINSFAVDYDYSFNIKCTQTSGINNIIEITINNPDNHYLTISDGTNNYSYNYDTFLIVMQQYYSSARNFISYYDEYDEGWLTFAFGNIHIYSNYVYNCNISIKSNNYTINSGNIPNGNLSFYNLYAVINGAKNYNYSITMTSTASRETELTKTYDVETFYNNNLQYNQIIVNGMSNDNSTFSSVTSITYNHNTENYQAVAYNNGTWASGYNSVLQYLWNETEPTISNINSDLNSLITFSTSVVATPLDKSYSLEFQQNGSNFTSIRVVGTTINGTSFNAIQRIDYNSEQVYTNNNFLYGYNNYLGYTYTPPNETNLANLNSDLGGLLVFYTVQVNPTPEEKFFHDIDMSTNGILTIVYAFANNLLSNIVLITMCVALPLVSFAVVQVIRLYKIKKGQ